MFSIISRKARKVRQGVGGKRKGWGMIGGSDAPSVHGEGGERKDCDFALDDGTGERHSAHRKVGHGGRPNPTGNTNRF